MRIVCVSGGAHRGCALVAFVTTMLLLCSPATALDLGEWVPGLRVNPFLAERVEYESNVFQVPSHAQDDVIVRTIPGVLVEYGAGANWVSVGYRAEILNFLRRPNLDAVHHLVLGQLHLESNRLTFNVRESFIKTTDPATTDLTGRIASSSGTELTGRIASTTNTVTPDVRYRLTERFSIGANANWTHVTFPTFPQLDREEYLAGGSVFWKILPKADVRLDYSYGRKEFASDPVRDVTRHVVLMGLRGDLTAKLSSTFRIGYEDRQPTLDTSGLKGYRGLVGGGDWIYRPTDRLTITLLTDRSVQESIFESALYYIQTIGTLVVAQKFGPKLTANARVTGGVNLYPTKFQVDPGNPDSPATFRKDTILGWGAGVGYDIQQWLRVGFDFLHTSRDSNISQFSFKDDKVAATVTLQF